MIAIVRLLSIALIAIAVATHALAQSVDGPAIIHNSGHSNTVNTLAFSPDGRWLASGSSDSTIKLWDRASGRLLRTLVGHTERVTWVQITPDGKSVVSLSEDGTARVWDAATGKPVRAITNLTDKSYDHLQDKGSISANGKILFTNSFQVIRQTDLASGSLLRSFASPAGSWQTFAVSPDDSVIAVAHDGAVGAPLKYSAIGAQVQLLSASTGKLIRVLGTYSAKESVTTVAFSENGQTVAAGGNEGIVKVWDVPSGRLLYTLTHSEADPNARFVSTVRFSHDSRVLTTAGGPDGIKFWDVSTGRLLRALKGDKYAWTDALLYSPDGDIFASAVSSSILMTDANGAAPLPVAFGQGQSGATTIAGLANGRMLVVGPEGLSTWDVATWQMTERLAPAPDYADGRLQFLSRPSNGHLRLVTRTKDSKADKIEVWDASVGTLLRTIEWGPTPKPDKPCPTCATYSLLGICISPDGRWIAATMWGDHTIIKVWNADTGQLAYTLPQTNGTPYIAADVLIFSADSRWLVAFNADAKVQHWLKYFDLQSGSLARTVPLPAKQKYWGAKASNVTFSPDERSIATDYDDTDGNNTIRAVAIIDPASGKLVRAFAGQKSGNSPSIIRYAPDGQTIYVGLYDSQRVNVWDVTTGRLVRTLDGNPGQPRSIAFSQDGRRVVVGNNNGTSAVFDVQSGIRLATTLHAPSGDWVTITPEGFFVASDHGAQLLHVVRDFETVGIDQFYQALYRPDLVREKLAGDPRGLVRAAAAQLDLNKVVASGSAPDVKLTLPGRGLGSQTADGDSVSVEAEITDRGGGIGRVEWRVNGVTVGVDTAAPATAGQPVRLSRSVVLDPGDNTIEVVAYNAANLIASVPARANVAAQVAAPSSVPSPVPSGAPAVAPVAVAKPRLFVLVAGVNEYADQRFKLSYAVSDAKDVARGFKEASGDLYQSVEVRLMIDAEVTRDKLDAAFAEIAGKASSSDVFVLYLAGHGKTVDGRYYFVPQDFTVQGELSDKVIDASVKAKAIAQEQWQKWFAEVPARKSVILFDTCESGTLAGDETGQLEKGAANDRLSQATGRSILAASGGSQEALEGFHGHGLFTYEVLDAINQADGDRNGTIELSELAAYVYAQVAELSQKIFKQRQVPQMKITANYPLAKQTRILQDETTPVAAAKPTFQISQAAQLQVQPGQGATVVRSLSAKTAVTVLESNNGWSLVAADGKPLGYVATRDLAPVP